MKKKIEITIDSEAGLTDVKAQDVEAGEFACGIYGILNSYSIMTKGLIEHTANRACPENTEAVKNLVVMAESIQILPSEMRQKMLTDRTYSQLVSLALAKELKYAIQRTWGLDETTPPDSVVVMKESPRGCDCRTQV